MRRHLVTSYASQCRFLGPVEGSSGTGWTPAGDRRKAINNLRAAVSDMGGNAVVQIDIASTGLHSIVQGDAYLCPATK